MLALVALAMPHARGERRPIDLNIANQAELEMVKGIGPQLSERILAEREHGRFADWSDFVQRMKGLGPTHASRLSAAGLRIDGRAYAGTDAAARPATK